MTLPKISVVMPIYHVEKFVGEAVRSVLDQTFADFELICVDDGGTDASMDIVRGFSDPRIRIVCQANRGLAGARNTGIANARGEFVALLDSDDVWHPEKLALHYIHLMANREVGVSYAGSRMIDQNGNVLRVAMRPKTGRVTAKDIICRNPVGNGSAPVLRRSALDLAVFPHPEEPSRTCWFDESFRQSEDIEMWIRLAVKHEVVFAGIDGLLTDYRIIPGALSANVVKQYLSWTKMLRKLRGYAPEFVEQHGDTARAYQLRYLARRSVQLGNFELARDLMSKAVGLQPRILAEEPRKTVITAGAIAAGTILGADRFTGIMRPFLRNAA
ncbi:glucosyltransferase [Erythrobacter sp. NAP1]|uniref:glycosyltransferase family 2 protein n=1 Tax=Erythrobacter sp. NAP1 TaxID=237727 RepID=UPI0000686BB3|nr:glycosyltransferase family 2 protein [Erythrobacter sp. NAP1]EAQ29590.1 glucosyltransferase [Erythrobacter sp. NAP1]